jgi:hypothetical protein
MQINISTLTRFNGKQIESDSMDLRGFIRGLSEIAHPLIKMNAVKEGNKHALHDED